MDADPAAEVRLRKGAERVGRCTEQRPRAYKMAHLLAHGFCCLTCISSSSSPPLDSLRSFVPAYLTCKPIKMYTTFSCRPQQAAVRTHMDTARCLPPAYNKPSVTIPSGKSWAGPQHSHRDATLKSRGMIKVVDLIGDDKGNEPHVDSCANHAKDGNDDDINDFPSLEEILHKEKWKRAPNHKRNTAEPVHNSN